MRIGIDFDNTIICYDNVFTRLAIQQNLVPSDFKGTKTELRDTVRKLPDGDTHWMRLQGKAYGLEIKHASLFDGFKAFIEYCNQNQIETYIVSHKTAYGHFDETRTSLRTAAKDWLRSQGFFDPSKPHIPETNLYFETTREEKIERIRALGCTHFIDDLIEVLDSPLFPRHIERILFQPKGGEEKQHPIKHTFSNWHDIKQALFQNNNAAAPKSAAESSALTPDQLSELQTILECNHLTLLNTAGGGNSKVYCVEANGKKWAVKSYPPYAPNQRDRLSAESATYKFLNTHQVSSVPTFKGISTASRLLVIEWIDGEIPDTYTGKDIDQAITFIRDVTRLNHESAAQELPEAAEACLSLEIIIEQIQKRLERLQAHEENEPELKAFLQNDFKPVLKRLAESAKQGYAQHAIDTQKMLPKHKQSLIPADFGFHNTIRDKTGKLYFFDFDYFGWDDPVKLLADILWHPKMTFNESQRQHIITGISSIFASDDQFAVRFKYTYPLFGLRWTLILLNEFIPHFWQNRKHAEVHDNREQAKKEQLTRAKSLLALLNNK